MDKKVRIVTHSGGFHADDVLAVATLMLVLGDDVEVVRSRDPEVIATGDYVVDVGNVYNPEHKRFDHHQKDGAGIRENTIPYAAFGLVWKEFGEHITGSADVTATLDRSVVQSADAGDNGVTLYELTHPSKVGPFHLNSVLGAFEPARGEAKTIDEGFMDAVRFAKVFLQREITHARADVDSMQVVRTTYAETLDKRLIVIEADPVISRTVITTVLCEYPEPLFFVRKHEDGLWQVVCVNEPGNFFARRKSLPESWAGKHDNELAEATGVADAVFCHNGRFMAVAKSKEGALKLAEIALSF